MYNLEVLRNFKLFFRVEGALLGFKISLNRKLNSQCFYDFGLKYKLKGYLKNFFSWKKIFLNHLYFKSLYLKKNNDVLNNSFGIIQKKKQTFSSLYFCDIFVNHYEKLKKFHIYKLYDRLVYMNYEKCNSFPLEIFEGTSEWFVNLIYRIEILVFGKLYNWLQNFQRIQKNNFFWININSKKIIFLNSLKLLLRKKKYFFFLKFSKFFKRPFLKYAYYDLFFLKLLAQKKNLKKFKFKFKFKFFKKRRKFKFIKKNYGAFLQFLYGKTYVNNFYRYLLYNWNIKLKSYYKLIAINFRKRNENHYYATSVLMKKKNIFFFFYFLKWPKKFYLNLLPQIYIIILVLYKKNLLINFFYIIPKLLYKFKLFLIELIKSLNY